MKFMTNQTSGYEVHDKPDERMHDDAKFMTNQVNRCEVHNDVKFMTSQTNGCAMI